MRAPAAPARRPGTAPRSRIDDLATAVGMALQTLPDPTPTHPAVTDGRLERMLRTAVGGGPTGPEDIAPAAADQAAAAIRVACAYLAAGDLTEAHLALLTAEITLIGHQAKPAPTTGESAEHPAPRERAVS